MNSLKEKIRPRIAHTHENGSRMIIREKDYSSPKPRLYKDAEIPYYVHKNMVDGLSNILTSWRRTNNNMIVIQSSFASYMEGEE